MLLPLTEADVPLLKSLNIYERPGTSHHDILWNLSQTGVLRAPGFPGFIYVQGTSHGGIAPSVGNLTALTLLIQSQTAWGPGWTSVGTQTCQVILDILCRCSQLLECPFLHTLHISSSLSPLQTSGRLLSRLSMPDLQDFELQGYGQPDTGSRSDADSLASALAASTRLEFVNIDSVGFSAPSFMELLRSLPPTVQRLHVTEPRNLAVFDDDVFKELVASPNRPIPLPDLRSLP
ncbi:hypothetical protein K438DRAFT_677204 [Mycena galopus ATCC 62051]|nr:hypothetical protein K438DRAFT_677204 [Mycena galopus ATCC 62051]